MIEIINSLIQFYPDIFLFFLMQVNVWIDILQKILFWQSRSVIHKNKSQAQEEIINTSARSFIQSRRSPKFHPELVFRVRSHGAQIDREFLDPTTVNIRTRPVAEIDGNFELKPGLINMVQSNQFCGKAHEDASAHLQHFLEICSTFTISGVPRDATLLLLMQNWSANTKG